MIIPFDAGNLTRLAADAGRHVDILTNFLGALRALTGNGSGVSRDLLNLKCLWVTHLLPSLLYLLDLYQEALELRRIGVWIDRCGRKLIRRSQCGLAFVFSNTAVAPVNRYADLIGFLTVNHHRLDAF